MFGDRTSGLSYSLGWLSFDRELLLLQILVILSVKWPDVDVKEGGGYLEGELHDGG